jgi:hypothetical protein
MKAQISYIAPIEVVVDTETGEIDRVVVIDESIALDRDDCAPDRKAIHGEGYTPLEDQATRDRALLMAETAEWPAWHHGW